MAVRVTVNGAETVLSGEGDRALEAIRDELGLTGTKEVCGTGVCGACTVLVDDTPVVSCLLPREHLEGRRVETIEGLADGDRLHPVQAAFWAYDAFQCGFCTPGFVVEAVAFYRRWREAQGTARPGRQQVAAALAGHLCRCGAYPGIFAAVEAACGGEFDQTTANGARKEGRDKLTGAARFTVDVRREGMLQGRILRSPLPHAEVLAVDPQPAISLPGVRGWVELLGRDRRVRYVGQPIGAVAAVDAATAAEALSRVVVTYRPLPAAVGMEQALQPDAPDLHQGGWHPPANNEVPYNYGLRRRNRRGPYTPFSPGHLAAPRRVARARRAADPLLVEERFSTSAQVHTAFEPHAALAWWEGSDRVVAHVSNQGLSVNAAALARRLGLPVGNVRLLAEHLGGAFGAKQGITEELVAAVELARAAGAPVRVVYSRREEMTVGGYRPETRMSMSLAGRPDGAVEGACLTVLSGGGASSGQLAASTLLLSYPALPKRLLDYDVVSNLPPAKPFRAPGGPPPIFAWEQALDELAVRLGEDPVALRRRLDRRPLRRRLYDFAVRHPLWSERSDPGEGRHRRGVGVAFSSWLYAFDPRTEARVSSGPEGFRVDVGAQDMGNGTRTVLAAAVASTLGVSPEMVEVEVGDSWHPWGPLSSASRTTASVWPAAAEAARLLHSEIAAAAHRHGLSGSQPTPGGVLHAGEMIPFDSLLPRLPALQVASGRPPDRPPLRLPIPTAHISFGRGLSEAVHMVEVEVDTRLGRVRPRRVWVGLAAGRIHARQMATSQVHGGAIQGLGFALYEERRVDHDLGVVLTADLESYRIPGIADTPEIEVTFIEEGFEHVAGGGVGMAEVATVGVAAAVANAVAHATGRRLRHLPLRPDRVLAALHRTP